MTVDSQKCGLLIRNPSRVGNKRHRMCALRRATHLLHQRRLQPGTPHELMRIRNVGLRNLHSVLVEHFHHPLRRVVRTQPNAADRERPRLGGTKPRGGNEQCRQLGCSGRCLPLAHVSLIKGKRSTSYSGNVTAQRCWLQKPGDTAKLLELRGSPFCPRQHLHSVWEQVPDL